MPGEPSLSDLKVNLWMPLDIGPFLQDTAHLSAEEIGAYTLLLLYYWAHGPLPNDPKRLANIAKMPLDTWSNTHESLSMFFFEGPDGLLHQKGADRRRAEWLDKRLKAREKALKAINARWSKHRAKLASQSNTPSISEEIHREVLENYPTSVIQVQKQRLTPPTPPPGGGGDEGKKSPPTTPRLKAKTKPSFAPTPSSQLGQAAIGGETLEVQESAEKAKTGENDSVAPGRRPNGADRGQVQPGRESARAASAGAAAGGKNLGLDPGKADPREDSLKSEVLAYFLAQNPGGPELHFSQADGRALRALLRDNPGLDLRQFKTLLGNRARSEVNPAAAPHKWLRSLLEYAAGPLGKYGKPLSRPRQF